LLNHLAKLGLGIGRPGLGFISVDLQEVLCRKALRFEGDIVAAPELDDLARVKLSMVK
jgi:hypothetical protein